MNTRSWEWWALVALAATVLIIPTVAVLTLQERALGPTLATAVVGAFLAELLERRLGGAQ